MARRERQPTPDELALIRAQTQRLGSESVQAQQELQQKGELARQQMQLEEALNASKIGLGREELGQKTSQGQLAAAIEALTQGSKENIAAQGERGAIASDLAKRTDLPQDVLASTLAESGQPGLYNALARSTIDKRERLINSVLPAIKSANSDAEREKKIKPALEAAYPGAYQEALARAFPKSGQEAAGAAPAPKLWEGAASAAGGSNWASLANTLLGKAGVTIPGAVGGENVAPVNYNVVPDVLPEGRIYQRSGTETPAQRGDYWSENLPGGLVRSHFTSGGSSTVYKPTTPEGVEKINAARAQNAARMIYSEAHPGLGRFAGETIPAKLPPAPTGSFEPATLQPLREAVASNTSATGGSTIPAGLVQGEAAPVTPAPESALGQLLAKPTAPTNPQPWEVTPEMAAQNRAGVMETLGKFINLPGAQTAATEQRRQMAGFLPPPSPLEPTTQPKVSLTDLLATLTKQKQSQPLVAAY